MKIFFLTLLLSIQVQASMLLVPGADVTFTNYKTRCSSANYVCTNDYFVKILLEKATPNFDYQMDHLDLNSKTSIAGFRNSLLHILNTEELSVTQLDMLLTLLSEINSYAPDYLFRQVQMELENIKRLLLKAKTPGESEFAFLFKQKIPVRTALGAKTTFLKIPLYFLHYASQPVFTNTRDLQVAPQTPLLTGECQQATMSTPLSRTQWVAMNSRPCTYTESFSGISQTLSHNQNILWLAGLGTVAVLIANNYEFSLTF